MPEGDLDAQDDWNQHWRRYGVAAMANPANEYRYALVISLVRAIGSAPRILDIGSGQGVLALRLAELFPQSEILGIEYSIIGVDRSREAAQATGAKAAFIHRDLTSPVSVDDVEREWASVAICSEVLEHVDHPDVMLRNALAYMAPGCQLIVTVPGGPRTAFDRHIGHRRHYTSGTLRALLESVGLEVRAVHRAGFPFFNLYKSLVFLRGKNLISDVEGTEARLNRLATLSMRFFARTFRWNMPSSPFGWQLVALAQRPAPGESSPVRSASREMGF